MREGGGRRTGFFLVEANGVGKKGAERGTGKCIHMTYFTGLPMTAQCSVDMEYHLYVTLRAPIHNGKTPPFFPS